MVVASSSSSSSPAADPYYADLPPITPASFGRGPSVVRRTHRSNKRRWCTWANVWTYAPVGLVLGLITYPYIPFVYLLAYKTTYKHRSAAGLALYQLLAFHALLALTLWSYVVALRTPAGSPTDEEDADEKDEEGFALVRREEGREEVGAGGLMAKASTGGRRWCKKCGVPKPDRCHHCSTCGKCILKMDHHCLWLSTCIGQRNYRAFLLFLTYVSLYSAFVAAEAIRTCVNYFSDEELYTELDLTPISHFILILDGVAFGLSLSGFAIYHWYLACTNQTTLETLSHTRSPPALALPSTTHDRTHTSSFRWRPDHLLTTSERRAARHETPINPWDVGLRRNLASLAPTPTRSRWRDALAWALPSAVGADGRAFETDPGKVARLRARTRRVRLGEDAVDDGLSEGEDESDRWGMADDGSGSESESESGDEEHLVGGAGGQSRSAGGRGRGWDTRTRRRGGDVG